MLSWGIVGTGFMAGQLAATLQEVAGARLAAVASRRRERAEAFAAGRAGVRAAPSIDALLADRGVDVVYVATPAPTHEELCLRAIESGKAVLCEKPLATRAAEAEAIAAAARRRGVFCMEAMWTRFLPAIREVHALVARGELGEPRMLSADLGIRAARVEGNRLFDPAQGGGALLDLGVYPISLAIHFLGAPAEIVGATSPVGAPVDEQAALLLRYPRQLAVLAASLRTETPGELTISGTTGRVVVHGPLYAPFRYTVERIDEVPPPADEPGEVGGGGVRARLKRIGKLQTAYQRFGATLAPKVAGRARTVAAPFEGSGYRFEVEEVLRRVRAGERESPLMPLADSIAVLRAVDALRGA